MTTNEIEMTMDEWLTYGMKKNWCGPPVCVTHDGMPTTEDEDNAWEEGTDPCMHMVRMYHDELERLLVEQNHSPSVWRRAGWE